AGEGENDRVRVERAESTEGQVLTEVGGPERQLEREQRANRHPDKSPERSGEDEHPHDAVIVGVDLELRVLREKRRGRDGGGHGWERRESGRWRWTRGQTARAPVRTRTCHLAGSKVPAA